MFRLFNLWTIMALFFLLNGVNASASKNKLTPAQIIILLNSNDQQKLKLLEQSINKEWVEYGFRNYTLDEQNIIFEYCLQNIKSFPWNNYLKLSDGKSKELSDNKLKEFNLTLFMFSILVKGYLIDNKISQRYAITIENNPMLSDLWNNIIEDTKTQRDAFVAKMLLASDYNDKLKLLYSFFKEQETSRNNNFLVGLSNDDQFLLTLKEDAKSKDAIISLIKNEFDKLKNDDQESRALRSACIRFYTALNTPEESLKWVEDILNSPNVSTYEKSIIKRNVVPRLKIELENK